MRNFDNRLAAIINFLQRIIISYSIDDPTKLESLMLTQRERDHINGFSYYILSMGYELDTEGIIDKVYDLTLYANGDKHDMPGNFDRYKDKDCYCEIVIYDGDAKNRESPSIRLTEPIPKTLIILIPKFYLDNKNKEYPAIAERFAGWYEIIADLYEYFTGNTYNRYYGANDDLYNMRKYLACLGFIKSCYVIDIERLTKDMFPYVEEFDFFQGDYARLRTIARVINNSDIDWNDTTASTAISILLSNYDQGDPEYWGFIINNINDIIASGEDSPYFEDADEVVEEEEENPEDYSCHD